MNRSTTNEVKITISPRKIGSTSGYAMKLEAPLLRAPADISRNMAINAPKTLTAEAVVDVEAPSDVKLSPSGKYVVYSLAAISRKDKHDVSAIWVAEVGKEHSARQLTSGLFNDTQPRWSTDGEAVAFISDRAQRGESSAIYLLSLKGGEAYPLTQAKNQQSIDTFEWSPSGKFIAYLSADEKTEEKKAREAAGDDAMVYGEDWAFHRLRYVHAQTREVTTLVSKAAHITSIAWNAESNGIVYTLQKTPELDSVTEGIEFQLVSLVSGKTERICGFPGATSAETWGQDILHFVAGVRPSADNTCQTTYKVSLDDGKCIAYAYGKVDEVTGLKRDGNSIWVAVSSGLSTRIELLDGKGALFDSLHRIEHWDIMSNDEGAVLVLVKSSVENPSEVYSWTNGELCQLSQHGAEFASLKIGTSKPFYCKAGDGTKLDGLFMTPGQQTAAQKKPWPTFVQPHGGPHWASQVAFNTSGGFWAPWVVAAGYAVLTPNYRGGSGRGDNFAKAAIGGMGTVDYDDVISMVKAGIAEGLIDENKVVIGGWSQGGFLSYLAVTRPDFTFRGAICGAGVSDWDMMSMTSDVPISEAELAGKAPWEEGSLKTQDRRGSPIWHMKNVKTPILILHGEKDVRVPTTQAIAFHRGCLHYKIPCEMVIYPREGHGVQERRHRIDILERVRRFLDLHLS